MTRCTLVRVAVSWFIGLSSPQVAIGQAGPPVLSGPTRVAALNDLFPGSETVGVHLQQVAGDRNGAYRLALSVRKLPAAWGGVGEDDIVTGIYDEQSETLTLDLFGQALNGPTLEARFAFERTGTMGCLYRTGGIRLLSVRASANVPWGAPTAIVGLRTGIGEGVPAWYDDRPVLIVVEAYNIVMLDLDANGSRVIGSPRILVQGTAGAQPRSPMPVYGPDGNIKALWHTQYNGITRTDLYYDSDLDAGTPSVLVLAPGGGGQTFIDAGGGIGTGTFYYPINGKSQINRMAVAVLTGDTAAPGARAEFAVVSPFMPPRPSLSAFFVSSRVVAPMAIPGIDGSFALDARHLTFLGITANMPDTGAAVWTSDIPNSQALVGARIPLQALVLSGNGAYHLSNTAAVRIE